jgi:carbon starvation protein CstA
MFGVANQSLAILALAIVTTWLVNVGRGKWAFVTIVPMVWVCSTTLTAAPASFCSPCLPVFPYGSILIFPIGMLREPVQGYRWVYGVDR